MKVYLNFWKATVGEDGLTYRNRHCSICNGIKRYQTWHIVIRGFITPLKEYDIDKKLKFLLANGAYIQNIKLGGHLLDDTVLERNTRIVAKKLRTLLLPIVQRRRRGSYQMCDRPRPSLDFLTGFL